MTNPQCFQASHPSVFFSTNMFLLIFGGSQECIFPGAYLGTAGVCNKKILKVFVLILRITSSDDFWKGFRKFEDYSERLLE